MSAITNSTHSETTRRVAVTGMGAITPAGLTPGALWDSLMAACTAIGPITRFDTSAYKSTLAAEVKGFSPDGYMRDPRETRRMDLFTQYAMAAAHDAVADSGLDFATLDHTRAGIVFGSGIGGLGTLEAEHTKLMEKGPGRVSALMIPMLITNIAFGYIAIEYQLEGYSFCPVTACATGSHAIGEAFRAIKNGLADVIITGGGEATITPLAVAAFQNMTTLSSGKTPEEGLLAFDRRRTGFVMGEGAGALILEEMDAAIRRGARIYGEVVGYGCTCDAYHITSPAPDGRGAQGAMRGALAEAGVEPAQVGYINAHGTGTVPNDRIETQAIKSVFGGQAKNIPISSTKTVTGHMLGAAGAVEGAIALMAITRGTLPPTANLREPDPECDLDYIPLIPREAHIDYAMSNTFGFGGTNACILFKRFGG